MSGALEMTSAITKATDGERWRLCLFRTAIRANWCPRRDSNPEPTDYESAALTVELQGHNNLQAVGLGL